MEKCGGCGATIGGVSMDHGNVTLHLPDCSVLRDSIPVTADPVDTPPHYRWMPNGIECKDVAQHFNYPLGNVIKYVWRCDHKGKPIQDLEKALTYLQMELERRREQEA